ncbi:BLUF domain-containing protein [Rhodoferax aquaticus]|uniref:BLUF domain-containing protein n=1 Tax=Rhodoferax aquaticus TaxID=2527691 RepID=A0A515EKX6_9BURK|nr:BLUF domain-containing protein [Rhodoferax aquaticus]QDL53308.1 hypothetical protein EXZ61_03470 [Rhodoferax aquaticus]
MVAPNEKMPLDFLRLVYVSSLVDEYGFALAPLLTTLSRDYVAGQVSSLTVFANGSLMQMLEGERAPVRTAFAHVRAEPVHFGITLLVEDPIAEPSIGGTHLGLLQFVHEIGRTMSPSVELFQLSPTELSKRLPANDVLPLFTSFASGSRGVAC